MEKEEVLKNAQRYQEDEYFNKVVMDSKARGMNSMFICLGIFAIYFYLMYPDVNVHIFQSEVSLSVLLFFPGQLGCCIENLYRYKLLKEKKRLFYGLCCLFLTLMISILVLVDSI